MIEVAAGLAIADKTVKAMSGVLKLVKDTRETLKQSDPKAAEALGEVREAINETLDHLTNLKMQHYQLLVTNEELQKANDLREQFKPAQIAESGSVYAHLPIEPEKHAPGLMLCSICVDERRMTPLTVDSSQEFARCLKCKITMRLRLAKSRPIGVSSGRSTRQM